MQRIPFTGPSPQVSSPPGCLAAAPSKRSSRSCSYRRIAGFAKLPRRPLTCRARPFARTYSRRRLAGFAPLLRRPFAVSDESAISNSALQRCAQNVLLLPHCRVPREPKAHTLLQVPVREPAQHRRCRGVAHLTRGLLQSVATPPRKTKTSQFETPVGAALWG